MSTPTLFHRFFSMKDIPKWRLALRSLFLVFVVAIAALAVFLIFVQLQGDPTFDLPPTGITASDDPELIARGRYLVHGPFHCGACHAFDDGKTAPPALHSTPILAGGQVWDIPGFGTFRAGNLTSDPTTGLGRRSDEYIARVLKHGVDENGKVLLFMAMTVGVVPDEEIRAVLSYLRTLPAQEHAIQPSDIGIVGKALLALGRAGPKTRPVPTLVLAENEPSIARGEYLARGPAECVRCHSPIDPLDSLKLKGALMSGCIRPDPAKTPGLEVCAPNLTPHPTAGRIAKWTEDAFVARFNHGANTPDSAMPWREFAAMTDVDKRSIYRWLRSLPAIARDTGPSIRQAGSWSPAD